MSRPVLKTVRQWSNMYCVIFLFKNTFNIFRQDCNEITKVNHATENFVNWVQPEVLAGGRPTIQSDVYSLCALTWETFMGRYFWGILL